MKTDEVMRNPLYDIEGQINQIYDFYKDIVEMDKEISEVDYEEDILNFRDDTERLRVEYSILYSKLLDKR